MITLISTNHRFVHARSWLQTSSFAGAIAGLVGGFVMSEIGAVVSLAAGGYPWLQDQLLATMLFGAAPAGFLPIMIGKLLHLCIAMLLGLGFDLLVRRVFQMTSDFGMPLITGLAFGLSIWAVAYLLVLPSINPALLVTYAPQFVVQHLVFGLLLSVVHAWLRPAPYAEA
jgi:hypothetical protein